MTGNHDRVIPAYTQITIYLKDGEFISAVTRPLNSDEVPASMYQSANYQAPKSEKAGE